MCTNNNAGFGYLFLKQVKVRKRLYAAVTEPSVTTLQAVTWAGAARRIPRRKEQCKTAVRTVLRTGPGVQRPEAPTTSQRLLSLGRHAHVLSTRGATEQEELSDKVLSSQLSITSLIKVQSTS